MKVDVIVVGSGIFGVTAALELKARGYQIALFDPGPLPHPLAASTDISKVVRVEYGADELYMTLGEQAVQGWRQWNEELGETVYHEVGVVWLTRTPMSPGEHEYESYQLLLKRGHRPERLDAAAISHRIPAFKAGYFTDGFLNPYEGYAESGKAVRLLVQKAERQGVVLYPKHEVQKLIVENGCVVGIQTQHNDAFYAEKIVVAAGAWTPTLIPELWQCIKVTGQPVFHLKPQRNLDFYTIPKLPVYGADIDKTGWYGFPMHPHENVLKIAYHSLAREMHPHTSDRVVTEAEIRHLRMFLAEAMPMLVDAPIVYTRICLYCNTFDRDFLIAAVPDREGLIVATGGSGHGFKFGPVLGRVIADTVEGNPIDRFRWRMP